ncbi:hypothetical protein [Vibrio mimicus]|uniref:hypothetical protein n=1 Tax=Vibrio mimicus TaxID=674 RepID=UPI0001BADFD2|nr:hypothetical protein [Vibrio mimicus]EEY36252.1 hypothetical protein VII_003795 [Vibrio mimicus MB451]
MAIQAVEVKRDEMGNFYHPDYPWWWQEGSFKEIHGWYAESGLFFHVDFFDHSASEELKEEFYASESKSLAIWNPKPPCAAAFLLSIQDSEDGPLAIWAVHVEQIRAV